ncbi:unnamed protein product [Rodentolepis nana]|uniref:Uncharacterized protein n=1 Tax=Rodentolepis nana TaxID=102285 RepID=A0A0R3TKF0_RODNA|nr:unnamed protein product [Rodentolepis nana]
MGIRRADDKWCDLSGKEDDYSATNIRLVLERPDCISASDNQGSDLAQPAEDHHFPESQYIESLSIREQHSLQASTNIARERQIHAVLKSDMIIFTSF